MNHAKQSAKQLHPVPVSLRTAEKFVMGMTELHRRNDKETRREGEK